jgi:hypothetical protein
MPWIAAVTWALIAALTTNGLIAFAMGGLDRAWVVVAVNLIWLALFLIVCPRIYGSSGRPTPPG